MSPKPPKKHGKKRKRRRSPDAAATALKLLEAAALGKTRRVRKLLDRKPRPNVDVFDAEGLTPLHHASRNGHLDTAQQLLRFAVCYLQLQPAITTMGAVLHDERGHTKSITAPGQCR